MMQLRLEYLKTCATDLVGSVSVKKLLLGLGVKWIQSRSGESDYKDTYLCVKSANILFEPCKLLKREL